VGKTAILEGLATRIINGEVPEVSMRHGLRINPHTDRSDPSQSLLSKRVVSIDLAGIIAGSGIRGQFEEKFQALLKDIEESGGEVICFIDELRTQRMTSC
jgi:ATP-dependent Clp protease ATP-binding subunit ClpB